MFEVAASAVAARVQINYLFTQSFSAMLHDNILIGYEQ